MWSNFQIVTWCSLRRSDQVNLLEVTMWKRDLVTSWISAWGGSGCTCEGSSLLHVLFIFTPQHSLLLWVRTSEVLLVWGLMKVAEVSSIHPIDGRPIHYFLAVKAMTTLLGLLRQLSEEQPSAAFSLDRCNARAASWGGCNARWKKGEWREEEEKKRREGGRQGLLPGDEGRRTERREKVQKGQKTRRRRRRGRVCFLLSECKE